MLKDLGTPDMRVDAPVISEACLTHKGHRGDIPIVLDAGCSTSVTPHAEDFMSPIEPCKEEVMHGLNDSVAIKGIGWVEWPTRDVFGHVAVLRTRAYHMPQARIRLCSAQTHFQENQAGNPHQDWDRITFTSAKDELLIFPCDRFGNLPLMFLDQEIPQLGMTGQVALNMETSPHVEDTATLLESNHNISRQAKELLSWHCRAGHAGFRRIRGLIQELVLPTRLVNAHACDPVACPACQLSKQHRRTPASQTTRSNEEHEMAPRREHL